MPLTYLLAHRSVSMASVYTPALIGTGLVGRAHAAAILITFECFEVFELSRNSQLTSRWKCLDWSTDHPIYSLRALDHII